MKAQTKIIKEYMCEVCKQIYSTITQANICEQRPIREDKGVKVGDTVKITNGAGTGELAKVTKVYVVDPEWGHYAADRYAHTVALIADLYSYGTRVLTYDSYEVLPKSNKLKLRS